MGLVVMFCVLPAMGWGSSTSEWLTQTLQIPKVGVTTWTIVITTGHFGSDPVFAQATRVEIGHLFHAVGAKGDKVSVVSAELKAWNQTPVGPLSDLPEMMPAASAPKSRGGSDLEEVAEEIAKTATGPIIIFSSGPSQLPRGEKELTLRGGSGVVPGFEGPSRTEVTLPAADSGRKLLITAYAKKDAFAGSESRTPLAPGTVEEAPLSGPKAAITSPKMAEKEPEASPVLSGVWPILFITGFVCAAAGLVAGMFLKGPPNVSAELPISDGEVVVVEEILTSDGPQADGEGELEEWKLEAKKLRRQLDLVAQDLTAAAETLTNQEPIKLIELRQELARNSKALETWDEIVIEFIDSLQRVSEHSANDPGASERIAMIIKQLSRLVQRAGLDMIAPSVGDPVSAGFHRVEEIEYSSEVGLHGTVAAVLSPGFRRGENVIRPALVKSIEKKS